MTTAAADTVISASNAGIISDRLTGMPVRLCAAVAWVSVGAHVWMAWGHRAIPWQSALMLLMAAVCLPCAVAVWRGRDRAVHTLFAMALLMVAVHAVLLLGSGSMAGSHHAGMGSITIPTAGCNPHSSAMLGVIALELAVALLAAGAMRSQRQCADTGFSRP